MKQYSIIKTGNYLWNVGFVLNNETITECKTKHKLNIAENLDMNAETGDVENIFLQCEKFSIDFALMEPATAESLVYTHPADFGRSDLGSWAPLYDKL